MRPRGRLRGGVPLFGVPILAISLCGVSWAAGRSPMPGAQSEAGTVDWPGWRGPHGDGKVQGPLPPQTWSAGKNVLWKAAVPGRGHSSPCVVGPHVFITTADDQAERQILLCYDRTTGAERWNRTVHEHNFMTKHRKNSHASATPASDGTRVYVTFLNNGSLWVTAYTFDGNVVWQKMVGEFGSEHGYGSSPLVAGSRLIVAGDNLKNSFLAALDCTSGEIAWKTPRTTTGEHGSFASPVVARVARREQLLLSGMKEMCSYDPATGQLLWSCPGPAEVTANTVAWDEQLVFVSGGFPEKELLAIRGDGTGPIAPDHVAWRTRKGTTYVPSPLAAEGRLYVVADNGVATCFASDTGKELWQERLEGSFFASPVLAGDQLYIPNEQGVTYVLRVGSKPEIIARNDLGEPCLASLAISGGKIFLRSEKHLWCIAETPKKGQPRAE